jgi:isopentenyl-diphosphate delta-isomerase
MKPSLQRQSRSFRATEAGADCDQAADGFSAPAEFVTLVDACGAAIGTSEKHQAHRLGLRHAAFSVFLVDSAGRLIMQQRHPAKYHSGGLWANSCCGHPRPGEAVAVAAARRVNEELGVRVPLQPGFRTAYRSQLDNEMIENEIVSVFFGRLTTAVVPNPVEISQIRAMRPSEVVEDLRSSPRKYTYWLRHYFAKHGDAIIRNCACLLAAAPVALDLRQ